MKPLLLGEAPGRSPGPVLLGGRVGRRLTDLLGRDPSEVFDVVNLLDRWPGRNGKGSAFPHEEAAQAAARLDLGGRPTVVALGHRVWRALLLPTGDPYLTRRGRFLLFPHPSPVNRYWNDAEATAAAADVLRGCT